MRKLVHEALDRERIDEAADSAERARAHRQTFEDMMDYSLIEKVIDGDGVALTSWLASRQCINAGWLRERRINVPCGQQRRALLEPGSRDVRIAPHLMAPVENASCAVKRP